jgi:NADH-quinone oxidoreductase subunit I
MAIGVKVMVRPEREVSYIRATLKGMALTFKHMLQARVTMQYPEAKSTDDWRISTRWRGTHRMLTDEQGRSRRRLRALSAGLPANCIAVGQDEAGNRYPLIYEIDEFRCVLRVLPGGVPGRAIHVGVHYENSEYSRDRFVYDLERLQAQTHPVSTLWDPADPRGQ